MWIFGDVALQHIRNDSMVGEFLPAKMATKDATFIIRGIGVNQLNPGNFQCLKLHR
jgi:hypothetical protein